MKKLNVLVGCEESQAVCRAFREFGHVAFSNDIQECSGGHPEWHLQMDVFDAISLRKWDLIILHPPCTCLCVSGNATYAIGKQKYEERLNAIQWTYELWRHAIFNCKHVAMENPVGCLNTHKEFPKPQYIQPFEYGHPETKKTGLWLNGLPKLLPTNVVEPQYIIGKDGKKYSPTHYMSQWNKERGKLRSKTYSGIAAAMASQWSKYLLEL